VGLYTNESVHLATYVPPLPLGEIPEMQALVVYPPIMHEESVQLLELQQGVTFAPLQE
jgi:hypothetical protein